ncbi:helix-turn-helix domain-containing protein [Porcincola intestinalis]|uniref:helix-turn-helix domain-containing protein n=1 Tax=Porcincola intestinalis TaxID=2606632 RepID=UPI0023F21248|nr:helix-turn-helix domain-containing protein [Porcincola intestinalis]MCI6767486.1 helix-turn-helix domain-containing protein [Lachnospiraceae bacterium]MDD7059366.1 helix-turn-helix domain-containing protein [Porcincola intestinalis]MDY5283967.1 helix-turn-helix domain-containing protein [Porcincola intestinalis]
MHIQNPTAQEDLLDFYDRTAAERVGRRIREIRMAVGLSQTELGEKIGLSADRVRKYENGARKPKSDLIKKIADVLGVEPIAFVDPVTVNTVGDMYAFFEMEKLFGLKVKRENGKLSLTFGDGFTGSMNDFLDKWEKELSTYKEELSSATSDEEKSQATQRYNMWKWTFPKCIYHKISLESKEQKKARLEEQIKQLSQELSALNNDGN